MSQIKAIVKKVKCIDELYIRVKWRERKVAYGNECPDKTFYVIRRATCKVGLFSYVMTNVGQIEYAIKRGYIPVIDMQNNDNTYLEKEEVGRVNAWEYFFEQPSGYSLVDISRCRNVILGNGLITIKSEYPTDLMLNDDKEFERWHNLCQKYLIPKKELMDEAKAQYGNMFHGGRVLGVLCRGTDYIRLKPHGHPVQPSIGQMLEKAEEMMQRCGCKWLYLATEDENYYQAFKEHFGDRLKVTDAKRCGVQGKFNINDISYGRENEKYLKGKEYLNNILLLSMCDCLLAGAVGGTYGALMLNDSYDEKFIFDLGFYK